MPVACALTGSSGGQSSIEDVPAPDAVRPPLARPNLPSFLKPYLLPLLRDALRSIGAPEDTEIVLEVPGTATHGDLVTPVALSAARTLRLSPRLLAGKIVASMTVDPEQIAAVEIAGPGFINIRFTPEFHHRRLHEAVMLGNAYGRSDAGKGTQARLLCANADTTSPTRIGQARDMALCDTVEALLAWGGYRVLREASLNDRRFALAVEFSSGDLLSGITSATGSTLQTIPHRKIILQQKGGTLTIPEHDGAEPGLHDLLAELGADVVRFFLMMGGTQGPLKFDLDLARERSGNNRLFYLQYAHAQIAGVLRHAVAEGVRLDPVASLSPLRHPDEHVLLRQILLFPEDVARAARELSPQILARYLRSLVSAFQIFRDRRRIIAAPAPQRAARLLLLHATGIVLANGLGLLGVSAPERV